MTDTPRTSDWEREELVYLKDSGWGWPSLANLYGISERTAQRIYKQAKDGRRNDVSLSCEGE